MRKVYNYASLKAKEEEKSVANNDTTWAKP
jgi:hypothetical protein